MHATFSLLALPLLLLVIHGTAYPTTTPTATAATTTTLTTTIIDNPATTPTATTSFDINLTPSTPGRWLIPRVCELVAAWDSRVPCAYCKSVLETIAQYGKDTKESLRGLAWATISHLKNNVTATKAEIEKMVATGTWDKYVKDGLLDCVSMYDEAVDRAEEGLKLFQEKSFGAADEKVVMIQGDGYECEAWFTQQPGVKSPLTKQNNDCTYLSVMSALIIRMFDRTYTPWGTSWSHNVRKF